MSDFAFDFSFDTAGMSSVDKALADLPDELARTVIVKALADGTEVVRAAVEAEAPALSGRLAAVVAAKTAPGDRAVAYSVIGFLYFGIRAHSTRIGKKTHGGNLYAGSTEDPGVYWRWVEFGRPGAGGHTHQAANPFVRRGFDGSISAAVEVFEASAAERTVKAIATVARRNRNIARSTSKAGG